MAKKYNSNWNAKKLTINFNQKQWRQDFAFFIKEKKFWGSTRVTRSRSIKDIDNRNGIKQFEVYNPYGNSFDVVYQDSNTIISSSDDELLFEYMNKKRC